MYEHPKHAAARKAAEVPPLIDLTGWDAKPKATPSLEGQLPIPGLETVERDRKYRGRRGESKGQTHLF